LPHEDDKVSPPSYAGLKSRTLYVNVGYPRFRESRGI